MCNYPIPLVLPFIIVFLTPSVLLVGILLKGGVFPSPYLFTSLFISAQTRGLPFYFISYTLSLSSCILMLRLPLIGQWYLSFKLVPVSFNTFSSF